MSRKVAAAVLLLAAVGCSIWGLCSVEDAADSLHDDVFLLRQAAQREDYGEVNRLCAVTGEKWEKYKAVFCIYINHEHFDSIDEAVCALPYMAQSARYEYLVQSSNTLLCSIEHLKESESLNLKNIF